MMGNYITCAENNLLILPTSFCQNEQRILIPAGQESKKKFWVWHGQKIIVLPLENFLMNVTSKNVDCLNCSGVNLSSRIDFEIDKLDAENLDLAVTFFTQAAAVVNIMEL